MSRWPDLYMRGGVCKWCGLVLTDERERRCSWIGWTQEQ